MRDHSGASHSRRFIQHLDEAIIALSSAGADRDARTAHIQHALALLRGEMMNCARAALTISVADRLTALCEYMCSRLDYAHVHGVDAPFAEVMRLLEDLRRAWPSLDRTRSPLPAPAKEGA